MSSEIDINGGIDIGVDISGGGQLAAIVIGVLVAVICLLLIVYFACSNSCKCASNLCCGGRCHKKDSNKEQLEATKKMQQDMAQMNRHIQALKGQLHGQNQSSAYSDMQFREQPALTNYPHGGEVQTRYSNFVAMPHEYNMKYEHRNSSYMQPTLNGAAPHMKNHNQHSKRPHKSHHHGSNTKYNLESEGEIIEREVIVKEQRRTKRTNHNRNNNPRYPDSYPKSITRYPDRLEFPDGNNTTRYIDV